MAKVTLNLQIACNSTNNLPSKAQCLHWLQETLTRLSDASEITIRIVDEAESQHLNATWRGKHKPTNVLAFPFTSPPGIKIALLGDLVICRQIVEQEAQQQNKPSENHWAHMIVHGTLHLLGFDHTNEHEAEQMEALEIAILHKLNYPNPYYSEE